MSSDHMGDRVGQMGVDPWPVVRLRPEGRQNGHRNVVVAPPLRIRFYDRTQAGLCQHFQDAYNTELKRGTSLAEIVADGPECDPATGLLLGQPERLGPPSADRGGQADPPDHLSHEGDIDQVAAEGMGLFRVSTVSERRPKKPPSFGGEVGPRGRDTGRPPPTLLTA